MENHQDETVREDKDQKKGTKGNQPTSSSSSPIKIKPSQSSGTKFGVFTHRQPSPDDLMTDANGEPIPLDRIIKTANTMSSMMMAHKIALEDDFRLEPGMDINGPLMSLSPIIGSSPPSSKSCTTSNTEPSLQNRVKDIVHEAYWDLFREELASQASNNKAERKFDISKQLLRDIKQKMIDLLLPQHGRLKEDIEDKLDTTILDQLSQVESLNLIDYAKYILSVLSKLCAPVRDDRLKELSETTDIVLLYKGIMELMELMRLDFANFTLNTFKPHIKAHSQEYEREKFNEILEQQKVIGIDGLEYTTIWLSRAVEQVDKIHGLAELVNNLDTNQEEENSIIMTPQSSINVEQDKSSKTAYSIDDKILNSDIINKVLNAGYCELLEWTADKQKLYPETLVFDEATFKQLAEQYKVLLLTSSILLTAFAFIGQFNLLSNNEFKILIKSHIITLLTASYDNTSSNKMTKTTTTTISPSTSNVEESLDQVKLETIALSLMNDIRQKLQEVGDRSLMDSFDNQKELFKRQILDISSSSNRVKELARRRILEFVETLLTLDIKHQQKQFSANKVPPVNIPMGLNCLADEITLTMAQLVKIIRYNRRVFFHHYQDITVKLIKRKLCLNARAVRDK